MTLTLNTKKLEEKLIWFVTAFMFTSLYIFSTYSWGRYVLAASSVFIFAVGVILQDGFSFKIKLNMFYIIQILICVYCLFSCVWSIAPDRTLGRFNSMLQFLVFFAMLMTYFLKLDSIESLLDIVMWSGYAVSIYTFIYYGGISQVMNLLTSSVRLSNDFVNANSLGMLCAMACIIQIYKILYAKKFWSAIFILPTIMILAVAQSRKSFFMLLLGVLALALLKNLNYKNWLKSLFGIVVSTIVLFFLIRYLFNLDIFLGMSKRLTNLFANLTIEGADSNSSAGVRFNYIKIGLDYFVNRPIFGYGFSSSGIILMQETSQDTYFHNNFVELLTGGGIIGFVLYYSNYIYLLYNLIKMRKFGVGQTDICIILLFILLTIDVGVVSYYSKAQYFYFMICYIQVEFLKRKRSKYLHESVQNF